MISFCELAVLTQNVGPVIVSLFIKINFLWRVALGTEHQM